MRGLLASAAAFLGIGYVLGRKARRGEPSRRVAFRRFEDGGPPEQAHAVRDAGPSTMREPHNPWSRRDDDLDQTFPASDATAKY
ncbi:hypothetical protein ROJ8625_00146 [Roseivivax jejudonensis]|uniref:Uncharacterized protein n=1 Tax=Roseivivax jejudonensis TaxID=1529041 RepID=A0A1X6Y3P3_9RHOB|nr:hypothetical protein [Roseivivax jejudonensis]SLN10029.1 hypothetical protein ROJ8625_00146 [Roseivivax jejudonensis]